MGHHHNLGIRATAEGAGEVKRQGGSKVQREQGKECKLNHNLSPRVSVRRGAHTILKGAGKRLDTGN